MGVEGRGREKFAAMSRDLMDLPQFDGPRPAERLRGEASTQSMGAAKGSLGRLE